MSGQGTPTIRLQAVAGAAGTASVQVVAMRGGFSASTPATVTVRIGTGSVYVGGPTGPACYSQDFTYSFSSTLTQGAPQWHVYLNNAPRDEFIISNDGASVVLQPVEGGTMRVTATATDQCTGQPVTASTTTTLVEYTRGPYGLESCPLRQGRYASSPASAYPNPADDMLTITGRPSTTGNAAYAATIYNAQGKAVRQFTGSGTTQLNTANLPNGLYHILIEQGKVLTRTQVRIAH